MNGTPADGLVVIGFVLIGVVIVVLGAVAGAYTREEIVPRVQMALRVVCALTLGRLITRLKWRRAEREARWRKSQVSIGTRTWS